MRTSFLHRPARTAGRLGRAALALAALAAMTTPAWAQTPSSTSVTEPVLDLAKTTSLAVTIMKVMGALALTVGLMLLLAIWLRKLGLSRAGAQQGKLISIIDTRMIAPKKYVAVVQVADETLALGITDQQITMLSKLEPGTVQLQQTPGQSGQQPSFAALLGKVIKRDCQ